LPRVSSVGALRLSQRTETVSGGGNYDPGKFSPEVLAAIQRGISDGHKAIIDAAAEAKGEWFQDKACSIPNDDALIAELTAPTYAFTSTGKMVVESKADMKKRGMRSPDLADAFLLTFACGERRRERFRKPVRKCSAWAA
jgi:hypothetical protein